MGVVLPRTGRADIEDIVSAEDEIGCPCFVCSAGCIDTMPYAHKNKFVRSLPRPVLSPSLPARKKALCECSVPNVFWERGDIMEKNVLWRSDDEDVNPVLSRDG